MPYETFPTFNKLFLYGVHLELADYNKFDIPTIVNKLKHIADGTLSNSTVAWTTILNPDKDYSDNNNVNGYLITFSSSFTFYDVKNLIEEIKCAKIFDWIETTDCHWDKDNQLLTCCIELN